ncbi:MAG: LacI family transcriptional regulator [Limnochordales bacterium]|nr:LacI family DNA-binding transcriptional regulator [Limnochordales bacterium]
MATLRDVARLAGVSPATVSRVLNGNQQVAKELRERVHRAAAQVGYRAASPRRSRAALRQVGLIVPHVSSPFYCQVLAGVEREAFQRGYDLIFFTTAGRSHRNVIERVLQAPQVAGLVVITPRHGEERLLSDHPDAPPVVVVDHRSAGSPYPHVLVDNLRGAHRAVSYLLSRGYDDIAMIRGPETIQSSRDRIRGFLLALQEAGLPAGPERVWAGDFEQRSGYEAVAQRLAQGQKIPRALFCANDLMALGAINALREWGLRVPEDVAVMGFDDLPVAAAAMPPLTTVRQPVQEMGAIAFRMVVRLAAGETLESERIVLDTELVVRGSA